MGVLEPIIYVVLLVYCLYSMRDGGELVLVRVNGS